MILYPFKRINVEMTSKIRMSVYTYIHTVTEKIA